MMAQHTRTPTVFISYAWEDDVKKWVHRFASSLCSDGVDVKLDQWDMALGDHVTQFMERSIRENDFVLIICTPLYKEKADNRQGGVGYEGHIITGEVYENANHRKFIPILQKGNWNSSAPSFLKSKLYCDLRPVQGIQKNYKDLIDTLHGKQRKRPRIGSETVLSKSNAAIHSKVSELSDGESILNALSDGLPDDIREDQNANGDTVFVDSDGLQRIKVYQYREHCNVRIRCSRDWGLRACNHRKNHRNSEGWLVALRVEDDADIQEVLDLYKQEWGSCDAD